PGVYPGAHPDRWWTGSEHDDRRFPDRADGLPVFRPPIRGGYFHRGPVYRRHTHRPAIPDWEPTCLLSIGEWLITETLHAGCDHGLPPASPPPGSGALRRARVRGRDLRLPLLLGAAHLAGALGPCLRLSPKPPAAMGLRQLLCRLAGDAMAQLFPQYRLYRGLDYPAGARDLHPGRFLPGHHALPWEERGHHPDLP